MDIGDGIQPGSESVGARPSRHGRQSVGNQLVDRYGTGFFGSDDRFVVITLDGEPRVLNFTEKHHGVWWDFAANVEE